MKSLPLLDGRKAIRVVTWLLPMETSARQCGLLLGSHTAIRWTTLILRVEVRMYTNLPERRNGLACQKRPPRMVKLSKSNALRELMSEGMRVPAIASYHVSSSSVCVQITGRVVRYVSGVKESPLFLVSKEWVERVEGVNVPK